MYTFNLVLTEPPTWLNIGGVLYEFASLDAETLAGQGWLRLIYDPENELLGYADPVAETRDGVPVAVSYALGTVEERYAARLTQVKRQKKAELKQWLTAINGRSFAHAGNSDDFDDAILGLTEMVRLMHNNWATKAAISTKVTVAESKKALADSAPEFDLILKAKQGRNLALAALNALNIIEDVQAYSVDDAAISAVWAAGYAGITPTLETRLIQFPVVEG